MERRSLLDYIIFDFPFLDLSHTSTRADARCRGVEERRRRGHRDAHPLGGIAPGPQRRRRERRGPDQLTTAGQVTALGKAFEDLAQRRATTFPAGVVMVSDFDNNSGPAPVELAKRLGVPIYTIGVGPTAAVDLAVDLQSPPVMKKGERSSVVTF